MKLASVRHADRDRIALITEDDEIRLLDAFDSIRVLHDHLRREDLLLVGALLLSPSSAGPVARAFLHVAAFCQTSPS